jgi:hypothetical protein
VTAVEESAAVGPAETPGVVVAPNRLKRTVLLTARIVFTLAIAAAVAYATISQWSDVRAYLSSLSWGRLVAALIMALLGAGAATMAWRASLAAIGHRITPRSASQIYLIGMLAKYLPGSVWAFVLQMELGKRANLPRSRPFIASLMLTGLNVTVALPIGLFALPALFDVSKALAIAVLVLIPVSLVCAYPPLLTWLLRRVLKLVRRPTLDQPLTWRALGPVLAWSTTMYVALGLHLWLLADGAAGPGLGGLMASMGAMSVGLSLGMMAFLAPSGLGAREAIIVAALLPSSSAGVALGIALASRLILTASDLLAAGVAATSLRRLPRAVTSEAQPSEA